MPRRRMSVFSMSFLDVMSCGFGAVILIFLIINHESSEDAKTYNQDQLSEVRLLDYQVQQGEKDLLALREQLEETLQNLAQSQQSLASIEEDVTRNQTALAELDAISAAERESQDELSSDIEARQEELDRLKAQNEANAGNRARTVEGEGDRQYLTGLRIGGKHIVVAIDVSASMLDDTIVNVLIRRNMSDERRRAAPKWQRAIRTAEWIVAQLPLDAEFEFLTFNTETTSLLGEETGNWRPVSDARALDTAIDTLKEKVPEEGTSMIKLFEVIGQLSPLPDNVYLVTDSLPTQGEREPRRTTVSGRDRMDLFRAALRKLPKQVPLNVIMFPMEGDPQSAAAFWNVARTTGGSYISPSRDWP
ncbi:MAG: VWA domain-containing protein [Pseudomonadota bacterium]